MTATHVPADIRKLVMANRLGNAARKDVHSAQAAMAELGIAPDTEFYSFCSEFVLSSLLSPCEMEELVDVSEPSKQVAVGTEFVREVWGVPNEYVCFTTCQGEGGYLYSVKSGAVYDFSLAERDQFLSSPIAKWASFYEFIADYLCRR